MRPRFPERFSYMTLDVEDNEEQNLIRLFPGYGYFFSRIHDPVYLRLSLQRQKLHRPGD